MKKAFKVGVVAMAGAAAIGAFALTGCDKKVNGTFTGEYHYNQYNTSTASRSKSLLKTTL